MPCLPQVKRIHEYKRQFMNVLSIIHRYSQIKQMSVSERKEVHPPHNCCSQCFADALPPQYEVGYSAIHIIGSIMRKWHIYSPNTYYRSM